MYHTTKHMENDLTDEANGNTDYYIFRTSATSLPHNVGNDHMYQNASCGPLTASGGANNSAQSALESLIRPLHPSPCCPMKMR